jgi:hypothetical protein
VTKHHILYPLLGLILLACSIWIVKQEIAQARAEERSKAHEDTIKQIEDVRKAKDAELDAARNKPATVQTVTKYLPLPLPPKSEIKLETLPDSPTPQIVLTGDADANLKAIQNMEIDHLKCDNDLLACGKEKEQFKQNAQNWENAAKGGSKWHRFGKEAKCLGVLGGGAAIGSFTAGWKGAAVGGVAGEAACKIFW